MRGYNVVSCRMKLCIYAKNKLQITKISSIGLIKLGLQTLFKRLARKRANSRTKDKQISDVRR